MSERSSTERRDLDLAPPASSARSATTGDADSGRAASDRQTYTLERVLAAARQDTPPRLDPILAQQSISRALAAAEVRAPSPRRRWIAGAVAGAIAAALVLLLVGRQLGQRAVPVATSASELMLPSGDLIATTPGATLEVTTATRELRAIRLAAGAALFDVPPLAPGGQFVVHTPTAEITVVGTVFTVQVVGGATHVRVYEGQVRVRRGLAVTLLTPDTARELAGDPLGELATQRARARLAATRVASSDGSRSIARPPIPSRDSFDASDSSDSPDSPGEPPAGATRPPRRAEASPPPRPRPDPAHAQALLAARRFAEARDLAAAEGWHLIEGDAHRALGENRAAAAAYDRAIASAGADTCVAALVAARLHSDRLAAPDRALELLARASDPGCATRERALALAIRISSRSEDPAGLGARAARSYLESYPDGDHAEAARVLLGH
jgi:ferric-dicitrate binding protein FerR (iron transport regulator)